MANKELKSIRFPGLTDTYTVNSMPEGAEANMQLVTDADGVAKWEEKPFYSTQKEITVTWDGDTTDREVIDMGNGGFYKVSDSIIPRDNVIGRTFTVTTKSGSEEHVITEDMCIDASRAIPGAWFVVYDGSQMLGSGPAFNQIGSSGGLYYIKSENLYVSSLSFIDEQINTIEQKYLPEIPADKLPEIPADKLSTKHVIEINPDNSCSVSFTDAYNMVNAGSSSFSLGIFGGGSQIQTSYISHGKNISGTIQNAIIADFINISDEPSALQTAKLIWGESSGISVTMKQIPFQ